MARKPKPLPDIMVRLATVGTDPAKDLVSNYGEMVNIIYDVAGEIERLRAALTACLDYIEGDEVAHGRTYRAGREARAVLKREPPVGLEECVD